MNFNDFKEITINSLSVIKLQIGEDIVWSKEQPQPSSSYDYQVAQTFSDLTTDDKIQYSYTYDNKTWYSLNNLNHYEKYGVIKSVDDLSNATSYPNKLVNLNNVEYEFKNGQWVNLGEITRSFGLIGQISRDLRETTFPTDFYLKVEDVISTGIIENRMHLEYGSLMLNIYSQDDYEYRIEDYEQGGSYMGKKEEVDIDGVTYVHFYCETYPNDTVYVINCMWFNDNPLDYYGSSIVYPKVYDKTILDNYSLYQGYPYNSFDEVEYKGKGVIYNINGYLYKDNERTTVNPYNLGYGSISGTSITEIKLLDENITSIGSDAFRNCSGLTSIDIPNSVTSIGDGAFSGCTNLANVTIPNSVTSIDNSAFWNCKSLTSITIPNSVTSIGDYAFGHCTSLSSVTIPNSVTSIDNYAFWNCSSLTSVTIPNSVTSIGDSAFGFCSSLTSVTIPNSVTSIGNHAFWNCNSLTSIDIPNSVTSIGNHAFDSCNSLTSIDIPNSVTSFEAGAFNSCTSLASIDIPNSVTSIGDGAFHSCTSLTSITYDGTQSQFTAITKDTSWKENVPTSCIVHCTDGDYPISDF